MFVDDRLATVLRQKLQSDAMRRTQYRQLLDLLGSQSSPARDAVRDPSLVAAAWMRMNRLALDLPAKDRARIIGESGWRFCNPELATHLAEFEPEVASAALSRAQLSTEDWLTLIPRLPVRARGFLRLRRDLPHEVESLLEQLGVHDRGLPQPEALPETQTQYSGAEPDKEALDPLPGSDIPADDLPAAGFFGSRIDPVDEGDRDKGSDDDNSAAGSRARPIFFAKNRDQNAQDTGLEEGFSPEPFTMEELKEIAPEPLGDNPLDEAPLDQSGVKSDQTEPDRNGAGRSEISALVERIANFKRTREEAQDTQTSSTDAIEAEGYEPGDQLMPPLPLNLPSDELERQRARLVRGFGFAADAAGRIEWAESEVASMVIGARLIARHSSPMSTNQSDKNQQADRLALAFSQRQPIKAAPFTLGGAARIAGDWVVDAQPRFNQIGGFAGYVGRMRRPLELAQKGPSPAQREADRIRQLLHELRTPVTAVQGYSEVIQQQLFGSAPHEYRALAAAIASDAARILSGFEELDRLAKLETGAIEIEEGNTDVTALTHRFIRQLTQVLDARMAGLAVVSGAEAPMLAGIDSESAQSLLWRVFATLGGGCSAGEMLEVRLAQLGDMARLTCDLPIQLLGEDDLFAADAKPLSTAINPGIFGAGFALRLARAEARSIGGDLVRSQDSLTLTLPLAKPSLAKSESDFAAS